MKKLLIEDLHVESFVTAPNRQITGTVRGHDDVTHAGEPTCASGDTFCSTEPGMASCDPVACGTSFKPECDPTGGGGTTSEGSLCATVVGCSEDSCTGPYGCGCTTTMSFDYTFCQTMCC